MIKKTIFCLLTIVVITAKVNAQGGKTYVNRVFQDNTGSPSFNPILNPLGIQWSKSIKTSTGHLVTVGHTDAGAGGEDIYVVKYDGDGNVIFAQNYNIGASNYNDYGSDIFEAANGDFLICGTSDNGTTNNYDLVVLRVSAGGTLLNSITKDGAANKNDVGVAIKEDGSGNVVVAANTEASSGFSDYWVLMFSSSLSFSADNLYDYAGLNDIVIGMEIIPGTGINLIGASASSASASDYAIATFNGTTLSYISDARSSLPGVALDQALAYCRDAANNTYITGKAWNGTNFDIKTVKITAASSIAWSVVLNGYGFEDVGNSIKVDLNGNVIVGGFLTKSNAHKELVCVKYNGSSGNQIWQYKQSSASPSGDLFIKDINLNPGNGAVYFLGGSLVSNGNNEVIVGKIKTNGVKNWERSIKNASFNVLPSDIKLATDGLYIITILNATSPTYQTTKFTEFDADSSKHYNNSGKATYKKNELVVRFKANAINKAAIDNQIGTKISEFGKLSDFLTSAAYNQLILSLEGVCRDCDINVVKIFDKLPTTFTSTTSRLGETIPVPDLWTALLLTFPQNISIRQAQQVFKTLTNIIAYSEPNYITQFYSTPPPNDFYYATEQASLHSTTVYPSAHINVEEAWDIVPTAGLSFVKCGVFDTGIEYTHSDFQWNGASFSKVEGWDLVANQPLWSNPIGDPHGHGTMTGGIIGAVRNNSLGIAGIAGGDDGTPFSPGIQLYSLNILDSLFPAYSNAANAIQNSAQTGLNNGYDYGLDLSNNSWGFTPDTLSGTDSTAYLITEAVHFANRAQVTFVAARANLGFNSSNYPVNIDDDWVISVGGSGNDGNYCNGINCETASSYGNSLDLVAPASRSLIINLHPTNQYFYIGQTSMACANVTGVAGLLMSYMNTTNPSLLYNNLAPEDCEFILQKSATDIGSTGYDSLTGYGRLNAGAALRMVEKPFRALYHFGTNLLSSYSISKNVYSISDTILLTEPYKNLDSIWFHKGKYIVKTFQINATVNHVFPAATDSLMYYWPRPSSSAVLGLFNGNKKIRPRQRVILNSCTTGAASLTGYIYQVKDTSGLHLGWWPCDSSLTHSKLGKLFEYSVLVKNTAVGISENYNNQIGLSVFPNPAKTEQTLVIETGQGSELCVELYDLMGRKLNTIYKGKVTAQQTTLYNHVGHLPNSMYLYHIQLDGKTTHKKFIKE